MTEGKEYKRPSVTADIILENNYRILLVQRKNEPFKGHWAFPGGFLDVDQENVRQTAKRELYEETNLFVELDDLELVCEASNPQRDPRGHVVSLVYHAKNFYGELKAKDDATCVRWHDLNNLPPLAFDHEQILIKYLAGRLR